MELAKLKGLLGIPAEEASKDFALSFVLDEVEETILNYCNLEELPAGLVNTAYRMAIDLYRYEQPGSSDMPLTITTISEGDISTSFSNAADSLHGGVLKDYQGQLNRYRKLRW